MIYFTSDLHFFHKNILEFCCITRPYKTVQEMNESLVKRWNDLITDDDTVYILGDISFGNVYKTIDIINSLNGKKILIVGNHDEHFLYNDDFKKLFEEIHHIYKLKYDNKNIIMCHYPIYDYEGSHRDSMLAYGHRHGNPLPYDGRMKDVGIDATGKIAITIDEFIEEVSKKESHTKKMTQVYFTGEQK